MRLHNPCQNFEWLSREVQRVVGLWIIMFPQTVVYWQSSEYVLAEFWVEQLKFSAKNYKEQHNTIGSGISIYLNRKQASSDKAERMFQAEEKA